MRILKYRKRDRARAVNRKRHADNVERMQLRVTKGDTVRVMRGDDKGKEGKVLRVFPKTGPITVDGIKIVTKHKKARRAEEQSEKIQMPAPRFRFHLRACAPSTTRRSVRSSRSNSASRTRTRSRRSRKS